MSLIVHLALVFHVFIVVAVMVMVCGRHGIGLITLPPSGGDHNVGIQRSNIFLQLYADRYALKPTTE